VRLVPNIDSVPARVGKYLLPHERQVIAVKCHPAIIIPPVTTALGGLFAAVALNPLVKDNAPLKLTIWLLAGLLCVRFVWACINWAEGFMVFTSQRMLLISGALNRRARNIPLDDIKHLTFQRSRGGRVFNYGTFIIDIGGGSRLRIAYIPYPEQLYLEVNGLVFRDRDDDL
jgi:hypothetical protein